MFFSDNELVIVGDCSLLFKKISIVFLLLVACMLNAANIDVHKTSILVKDTVANDPLKLKQAFAQILANNTGEDILVILNNPIFDESNIKQGVKRSYFEKIEVKYLTGMDKSKYWFHLVMQDEFIHKVIDEAGFSLLPNNRDKILLWSVIEATSDEQQPELVYAKDDELSSYWLSHWAQTMGMVFEYPALDEQDMLLVTPQSIKSLSYQALEQTESRYALNNSLLVYVNRAPDSVKIRSGYANKGLDLSIKHFQENSLDGELIDEGLLYYSVLSDIVEKYASANKINSVDIESHTVRMVLNNIDSYDEIIDLEKYISSMSVIDSYHIISASSGQLDLTVNLTVSTKAFLNLIAREKVVVYNQSSPINQLVFSTIKEDYN